MVLVLPSVSKPPEVHPAKALKLLVKVLVMLVSLPLVLVLVLVFLPLVVLLVTVFLLLAVQLPVQVSRLLVLVIPLDLIF